MCTTTPRMHNYLSTPTLIDKPIACIILSLLLTVTARARVYPIYLNASDAQPTDHEIRTRSHHPSSSRNIIKSQPNFQPGDYFFRSHTALSNTNMSDSESEDILQGDQANIDPYEVLEVDREASADKIKSAYRKQALRTHPDKVQGSESEKQAAKEKFQQVALAYAVLSDPVRRKRYDATGETSESLGGSDFAWSDFYQEQFRDAISEDAIKKFADEYKNSDEEKDDLLVAYEKHEGNMDGIYEEVMLSNVLEDDERFRAIIDEAIANKDVEAYKIYTKESKKSKNARIKAAQGEATEAEDYAKELGVHDKLFGNKGKQGKKGKKDPEADLAALIQRNQKSRSGFLDNLAAKYGGADFEEPSEEAFQAAAQKLKRKAPAESSKSGKGGRAKKAKS
ncbi:hypothetical protein JX266_006440 [Neoarthrinium moseri]|nr:hypothetical protein JX266_006440 [Neoarthrinium moseri]